MITSALLRIDGVKGAPPAPFERPSLKADFWVLELAMPKKEERTQYRWLASALRKKRRLITRHVTGRRTGVLYLSLSSQEAMPIKFSPAFLKLVSGLQLGIEVYEENA